MLFSRQVKENWMRRPRNRPAAAAALSMTLAAGALLAQPGRSHADEPGYDAEFSLGIGYSRITFDGGGPLLEGRDSIHINPVVSFSPLPDVPQLRLGGAVGWSIALDDTRGAVVSNDGGLFFASTSDVTLMLLEPELRLSWRQPLGDEGGSFVEAGAAAGGAFGWIDVGDPRDLTPGEADANAFSEWDGSFQWKAFLRAGTRVGDGVAGIEAHYLRAGELEFADNLRGDPEEFYFGIFGALRF